LSPKRENRKSEWTNPTDTGKLTFGDVSEEKAWERPYRQIVVQFMENEDIAEFEQLIGQQLGPQTRSVWYPANGRAPILDLDRPPREYLNDLDDSHRPWWHEWQGMPECINSSIITGEAPLTINFGDAASVEQFKKAVGQDFSEKTKSIWHPAQQRERVSGRRRYAGTGLNPRYPIYIISKGRSRYNLTARALNKMNVPYHVCVEETEYDAYVETLGEDKVIKMPFHDLGQGGIPARNFVWDHSVEAGYERHWIMDDNIKGFYRYNRNEQIPVADGTVFAASEDFVDRYENVGEAGFQYYMFVPRKRKYPSFSLNVRIYSCILIRNDLPFRWRGRYNEDTDLSIRVMKDGDCTILFNAFLADKMATMKLKGGNTDELYADDGRLKMAESLKEQHPDLVTIQWRWGRFQHLVDYRTLRQNRLRLKPGVVVEPGINNYGMHLQELVDDAWTDVPENPAYDRVETESDFQEEMF
jgi:hypothetical protein